MSQPLAKTLTVDAVNTLLVDYLTAFFQWKSGRVLVETQADARPPSGVYATIWWKEQELLPQNFGSFTPPETEMEEGIQALDNETLCAVRITLRGPKAYSLASEVRYSLEAAERWFDLWKVLGFSDASTVVDLSGAYGGRMQQRAFFDLSFYAMFGRKYPLDWFDASQWKINGTETIYPREEPVCL